VLLKRATFFRNWSGGLQTPPPHGTCGTAPPTTSPRKLASNPLVRWWQHPAVPGRGLSVSSVDLHGDGVAAACEAAVEEEGSGDAEEGGGGADERRDEEARVPEGGGGGEEGLVDCEVDEHVT
jgi:hypothetical protein